MALFYSLFILLLVTLSPSILPAQLQCEGDVDGDGIVSIDELVRAVGNSLHGCPLVGPRFVDKGDGTVIDNLTGLTWEKKANDTDCLHCVLDLYTWQFAVSDWLSEVNGTPETLGLGGFSDWRVPSIQELETIVDCRFGVPCIDPLLGPSGTSCYWTIVSLPNSLDEAITVDFGGSGLISLDKRSARAYVRAVRGTLIR